MSYVHWTSFWTPEILDQNLEHSDGLPVTGIQLPEPGGFLQNPTFSNEQPSKIAVRGTVLLE